MATFLYTWNATFLATPQDVEDESLGAQRIRDTKTATGERLAIDHSLAGNGDDGKHLFSTYKASGSHTGFSLDPLDGRVFADQVSGNTELFYQDSSGHVVQLTLAGAVSVADPIPSGTVMFFGQNVAPVGWTQFTAWHDVLLRLVGDGSGGDAGGSWTISGASVGSHVLTVPEMPSHTHTLSTVPNFSGGVGTVLAVNAPSQSWVAAVSDPTGGDGGHTHPFTSDGTWRPLYINAIVCIKN